MKQINVGALCLLVVNGEYWMRRCCMILSYAFPMVINTDITEARRSCSSEIFTDVFVGGLLPTAKREVSD